MGKPVPRFWWDFTDNATAIIVQGNFIGGGDLGRFVCGVGDAELQIAQAEALIADFESGRKTPKWNRPDKT